MIGSNEETQHIIFRLFIESCGGVDALYLFIHSCRHLLIDILAERRIRTVLVSELHQFLILVLFV